ncbi:hypothetical protein N665_0051s0031 [Sinapis alba]|nr:hypothetical protein N665_0051s0031 [Sinapis alba]
MKKKKPKIAPSKPAPPSPIQPPPPIPISTPTSPPTNSVAPASVTSILPNLTVLSEDKSGSPAATDELQPPGKLIPSMPVSSSSPSKTVIADVMADPSSRRRITPVFVCESSPAIAVSSSAPSSLTSSAVPEHATSPASVDANSLCEAFTLPSGEACIQIPNSVIEKNRKSWEPFVLGQFYSDPLSQGTLHNIVNGIWSKNYRDISVSKMEGFAFLFRIPNSATRHRVINQRLWQIEGQTMFVDKWEPGIIPAKPELSSAPIWLELRKVPFQFFNEDGLERILGLVFTVIDPRKPLPEAVNVHFETGEICRVLVSSPWMPPVCDTCKEIGHATKRCPIALKSCATCKSSAHTSVKCPQNNHQNTRARKTRRGRSKDKKKWIVIDPTIPTATDAAAPVQVALAITMKVKLVATRALQVPPCRDATLVIRNLRAQMFSQTLLILNRLTQSQKGKRGRENVSDIFPGWSSEDNYAFSTLGKIWIIWHPSLLVSIISKSLQMITVEVSWPLSTSKVIISIIYASNNAEEREILWSEIDSLNTTYGLHSKPWIIMGDFNQIRVPAEHSTPPTLNMDKRIRDFNTCLLNANLEDLNFRGTTFTWWNKQKLNTIAKKLDMCLVNGDWCALFPSAVAMIGSPEFSDHASISVSTEPLRATVKKPFKFYNYLLQNPDFLAMVCENWFTFNITGSAMFRNFSRTNYSGIENRTAEAHANLLLAQSAMLTSPSTTNASSELHAMKEWELLSSAESAFFFQRARINCISFGDGNSRLFHRYAASRQAQNHIHFLISDTGVKVESHEEIQGFDIDLLFDFKCSNVQKAKFEENFTKEKIKNAFFTLPKNKTGGPDGYSSEFFHSFLVYYWA